MKRSILFLAIVLIVFVMLPFFLSGFWIRLLTHTLMFCALASSLNIMAGFTGYAPFGNMLFFGVGAYSSALLMNYLGLPFFLTLLLAGLTAVLFSIFFGTMFLRLRGQYFALATTGAAEAMRHVVSNLDFAGGGQGMTVPYLQGSPAFINIYFYFVMLAMVIVVTSFVWWMSKSRLGYAFKAIRADEEAAGVMGIDTTRYKIIAWSFSALFTGMVGAVYAYWFSYIDPPTVFDIMWTVRMFVINLIGGIGTVFGPIIGAFLIETLSELVWSKFLYLHMGVLGVLIILVVMFMPDGIIRLVKNRKDALMPILHKMNILNDQREKR
jgi:branched-chain amino acid transport system permease protein